GVVAALVVSIAWRHDHVHAIVWQDETAGSRLGRDLGGNSAHARGKDRRHESRTLGVHELCLANRFAGDKRRSHDHAGQIFECLRAVSFADEISGGSACGPCLPDYVARRQGLAARDVGFGDKNIDSIGLWRFNLGRRWFVGSAGKQSGYATCGQRNGQYDDTCSFHTLTLTVTLTADLAA